MRRLKRASFQSWGNPVSQHESHISLAVYNVSSRVEGQEKRFKRNARF